MEEKKETTHYFCKSCIERWKEEKMPDMWKKHHCGNQAKIVKWEEGTKK